MAQILKCQSYFHNSPGHVRSTVFVYPPTKDKKNYITLPGNHMMVPSKERGCDEKNYYKVQLFVEKFACTTWVLPINMEDRN